MTKGERVKIKTHYDLFGNDVHDCIGIYISTNSRTLKAMVYFPDFQEWGEINTGDLERVKPEKVSKKDLEFVSRVKKLEYSF